jgi:hypothetical protein
MVDREQFIAGLREMADFFETNPTFDLYAGTQLYYSFPDSRESFLDHCRMLGSFKKEWTNDSLKAVKTIAESHQINVFRDRKEFCKRIVTPVQVPATEEFLVTAKPAHTRDEITWECPDDFSLIGEEK